MQHRGGTSVPPLSSYSRTSSLPAARKPVSAGRYSEIKTHGNAA